MTRSGELFDRARGVIPGGVNSPVRAYHAVGGTPRFLVRGSGAHVVDADGHAYIDYVQSWGALILGHADSRVVAAVQKAVEDGTSFGAPTQAEVELAERICALVPSIESVRLLSSGTEATMTAIRLARGFTGRTRIVKFAGCYHGHSDALLAKAGSGIATFGLPGSLGVPPGATAETAVAPFNDLAAVESIFDDGVACVIVEPVAANMGVISPKPGFLEGLRLLCDKHGALLIFDEVITGFRLGPGGAQERFGVRPDLTCLGKVLGGGLPLAAFGGRADVMALLAPEGPVYQAGTLSGNPLATAAGLAVLDALALDPPYARLEAAATFLAAGLAEAASAAGVPLIVNRAGSLFSAFFSGVPVENYEAAGAQDTQAFARFFHAMADRGVLLPPSAFECWFISLAHSDEDLGRTLAAARAAIA